MKKLVGLLAMVIVVIAASAQWSGSLSNHSGPQADDLPAYNSKPPVRPLPPVMAGQQLSGPYFSHAYQAVVYRMAAKIPAVLHQQPCYCRCDREMGHNSLHSCFEGTHGAGCSTCMKEAVYAYKETRRGRTPAQIRAGIERGEWINVDLEKASL